MPQVVLEDHGQIAVLRLMNGVTNAIGAQVVQDLSAALGTAVKGFGGLVLAGNAKFFSIGLDLRELLPLDRDRMHDFWNRFEHLVLELYTLPIPTACALAGHATGGGAILALACDYRFMANGRKLIALNEVKIGLPVPWLADRMLRQVVSDRVAVEVEFRSAFLGPEEAHRAGLSDGICAEGEVEARAVKEISELAAMPSIAFSLTKQHRTRDIPVQFKAIRQELNRAFMDCWFAPSTQHLIKEAATKF
jgi:enoyl-CoA hydratase/carnithine racemase